jgi:hypothetical protein
MHKEIGLHWKQKYLKAFDALFNLHSACMKADAEEELSEYVDGSLLDAALKVLKSENKS